MSLTEITHGIEMYAEHTWQSNSTCLSNNYDIPQYPIQIEISFLFLFPTLRAKSHYHDSLGYLTWCSS